MGDSLQRGCHLVCLRGPTGFNEMQGIITKFWWPHKITALVYQNMILNPFTSQFKSPWVSFRKVRISLYCMIRRAYAFKVSKQKKKEVFVLACSVIRLVFCNDGGARSRSWRSWRRWWIWSRRVLPSSTWSLVVSYSVRVMLGKSFQRKNLVCGIISRSRCLLLCTNQV